jgi:oligosaccharide repeat unit polymerase
LPIIGEYTILYILTVSFFWLIGSFVGRLLSLKIKNFFSAKSLFTEKNYIRLVFIIPIFYLFFRILDIFLITGNYSLNYENLALYRAILTTGINTVSNFFFFSFFNNLFFFLPCITFYYLLNKNITIFQSCILIFYFIFFVYLSTSRSTLFLSFIILFFFLAFAKISIKKVILIPLTLVFCYFLLGFLFHGTNADFTNILNYIILPLIAFDRILENPEIVSNDYLLILRFLKPLLIKFKLSSSSIEQLDYVFFENNSYTNVYTIFGVYVLSFGIVGATIFIFAIFISCKLLFTIY